MPNYIPPLEKDPGRDRLARWGPRNRGAPLMLGGNPLPLRRPLPPGIPMKPRPLSARILCGELSHVIGVILRAGLEGELGVDEGALDTSADGCSISLLPSLSSASPPWLSSSSFPSSSPSTSITSSCSPSSTSSSSSSSSSSTSLSSPMSTAMESASVKLSSQSRDVSPLDCSPPVTRTVGGSRVDSPSLVLTPPSTPSSAVGDLLSGVVG